MSQLTATASADLDALLDDGPRCTAGGTYHGGLPPEESDPGCGFPAAWHGVKPCTHVCYACAAHHESVVGMAVCRTCDSAYPTWLITWTAL